MGLVAVAATALVVSTGGFGTASMDRDVTAIVSEHDRALVTVWDPGVGSQGRPPSAIARARLDDETPVTVNGESTHVVAVLNRFDDRSITVDATVVGAPPDVGVGPFDPVTLAPGEAAGLEAPIDCGANDGPVEITLRLRASNDRFRGVITYDATVVCAIPTSTTSTPPETGSIW